MIERLLRWARALVGFVFSHLAGALKTFLLVIGFAGTGIGLFFLAVETYGAFAYQPAVATIVHAGWQCGPEIAREPFACIEAEAEAFRERGLEAVFLVTYQYTDAGGVVHTAEKRVHETGLSAADARTGAQFALRYDPDDPARTALPLGANHRMMLIGLAGLTALGLAWLLFWRRRRSEVPA